MAPPKRPWLRLYTEITADPKLRRIPPAQRWLWVSLLSVARRSPDPGVLLIGTIPATVDDLADEAAIRRPDVLAGLTYFEQMGMLDRTEADVLRVVHFADRQMESDSSTSRVAKHRSSEGDRPLHQRSIDARCNGDTGAHVTAMKRSSSRALVQESESESEKDKDKALKTFVLPPENPAAAAPPWEGRFALVRATLDELHAPEGFYDLAFWQRIDTAYGPHPSVFYLDELRSYLLWWHGQPPSRRRKAVDRSFATWLQTEAARANRRSSNGVR